MTRSGPGSREWLAAWHGGRAIKSDAAAGALEVGKATAFIPCPVRPTTESPSVEEIVQEEIARLPELFRGPVVLCCLEGLSYDLAARRLGLTEPTLRGRLHRARKKLASRLRGRGITAGSFTSVVEPVRLAYPSLPSSLVESTVQFSVRWSSVNGLLAGARIIPESIAGLAQGVIKTMLLQSIKLSGVVVLLAAGVLGTVVVAQSGKNDAGDGAAQNAANDGASAESDTRPEQQFAKSKDVEQVEKEQRKVSLAEKTRQVEKQLELVIDGSKGTSLEQLLKHIKQQTSEADPPGIPIYVSPLGLQEAKKSMSSPVDPIPNKAAVRVILEQALFGTGLSFAVRDGLLTIDSRTGILEKRVEEIDRKLDRVLEALDRLEKVK